MTVNIWDGRMNWICCGVSMTVAFYVAADGDLVVAALNAFAGIANYAIARVVSS